MIGIKCESDFVPPFFEVTRWSVPIPPETREIGWSVERSEALPIAWIRVPSAIFA